ncbi:MAG: hypothetical protein ABIP09_03375 [Gemmatimonadaceae bacterium]
MNPRLTRDEEVPLNTVVIARDGGVAVGAVRVDGIDSVPNRDATGVYLTLDLTKNRIARVGVLFSGTILMASPGDFGYPDGTSAVDFVTTAAVAAVGEYLDSYGLPPESPPLSSATAIECFSGQFEEWKNRLAATDSEVVEYMQRKAYWGWKVGLTSTPIDRADALRLAVPLEDMSRISVLGQARDWTIGNQSPKAFDIIPSADLLQRLHTAAMPKSGTSSAPLGLLLASPRYEPVLQAWSRSQEAAHGESRDFVLADREAINAVEGLARIVTGRHSDTLGDLIKVLKAEFGLNPAIAKSLDSVWGFTNTWPGVRHGAATLVTLGADDARFILDSCDAAIRLLLGIDGRAPGAKTGP